jgi:uncharacterized ion transporter superfamily protein YfcC
MYTKLKSLLSNKKIVLLIFFALCAVFVYTYISNGYYVAGSMVFGIVIWGFVAFPSKERATKNKNDDLPSS